MKIRIYIQPKPIAVFPVIHSSYLVSEYTNSIPTTFILGMGTTINLLCKDLWDKLPPSKKELELWEGCPWVGVAVQVCGSTVVEITNTVENFHNRVVMATALTAEAILELDFLKSNNCTLETLSQILQFMTQLVSVMLHGSSPEPVIAQARVTLEDPVQIPAFSEMEVTLRVDNLSVEVPGSWKGTSQAIYQ